MAATYEPIATTTLTSNTTITFTSIPNTYTDLVLILQGTRTQSSNTYIQVGNGSIDTNSNYSLTFVRGNGSAASSGRNQNLSNGSYIDYAPDDTTISTQIVQFMNYANTTTYKTFLNRTNNSAGEVGAGVNLWRSTSAINTIKIWTAGSGTLSSGYTATLYGIKAA